MMKKFKLKKGDQVMVISGKDKGKSGEIIQVLKPINKVKVRGINIVKKHRKPSQENPGKIEEMVNSHIQQTSTMSRSSKGRRWCALPSGRSSSTSARMT